VNNHTLEPRTIVEPSLTLFVEVPVCAFRPYTSREYQDTYPVPPPSTVYGMLLSLVGVSREKSSQHKGVAIALAVEALPQRSKIFRKLRRVPQSGHGDPLAARRPDYQDLLIDMRLWVWLKQGRDGATPDLTRKVTDALTNPSSVTRFGGLSLGESSHLVNSISMSRTPPAEAIFLRPDRGGFYTLPVLVDHHNADQTRTQRFSLTRLHVFSALEQCWIYIE
jgi:CRISPR-associated protein Cas5t